MDQRSETDLSLDRLLDLLAGPAGLVSRVVPLMPAPGDPAFLVRVALLGDVGRVLPNVRTATGGRATTGELDGAGSGVDEGASLRALMEAIERHASCAYDERQFVWATADELGAEALDLGSVPRCSAAELAHPLCPLAAPRVDAPMRWVRGISLTSLRPTWVPAVMVYLHIPWLSIGERFTLPISTGCAAHTDLAQALVNAICEVVERDALSIAWIQQLPLPRLDLADAPPALAEMVTVHERSALEIRLFDGTTDLGIPTVLSLELSNEHPRLRTLMMCASHPDPARAAMKVFTESAASRIAMVQPHEIPADPDLFQGVFDGATYMGGPERQHAFGFLLERGPTRRLSELPGVPVGSSAALLRTLVHQLRARGAECYAVELTTDEAARAGVRVVRIVIPALQPLTFSLRARYLGHPRLYAAPAAMGYLSRPEEALNPWPTPFA